ncbi:helix-turn-helix domain-containing protein [Nocardiopsis alba]|uniref:helix-turn-helix domain-containing protein n=1 Tax=Nocardiopsis alba TaxID=53437 RepID=UPI0033CB73BB
MRSETPVRLGEVGQLPVVLGPVEAGRMLGLGRTTTYRLLRQGAFPVPALRVGWSWRIPTAGILAHLGLPVPSTSGEGCSGCGARSNHGMEGES